VQGAAVHEGAVADAHIVADGGAAFLESAVKDGAVLDIDFISYPDKIHIAAYHRLEPHGALVAHDHIADNGGIFCEEAVLSELRRIVSARQYKSHVELYY
jgi:hypothetical protein